MEEVRVQEGIKILSVKTRENLREAARLYRPCLHTAAVMNLANNPRGPSGDCVNRRKTFLQNLEAARTELGRKGKILQGKPANICISICRMKASEC